MTSRIGRYGVWAGILAGVWSTTCFAPLLIAQDSPKDALQKAHVLDRPPEFMAPSPRTAPGFVLDPAWPKPLPHNWIVGDIGGIFVVRRDHIWDYYRPRPISSTDSGMLGAAAQDPKGNPINALGFPRPYGQLAGCCTPAPSVLEFDKA